MLFWCGGCLRILRFVGCDVFNVLFGAIVVGYDVLSSFAGWWVCLFIVWGGLMWCCSLWCLLFYGLSFWVDGLGVG